MEAARSFVTLQNKQKTARLNNPEDHYLLSFIENKNDVVS
jgi:hypothetical protein